jgi:hypothetical protein
VLEAIVWEGMPAPGMAGAFGAFPSFTSMRLADGGWLVFRAPIVGDPTADEGIYVWTPGRVLTLVFAEDDQAPSPVPAGTAIDSFGEVWITTAGRVVVSAELSGGAGDAILTANVNAATGVVSGMTAAIVTGDALPAGSGPSPLAPGNLLSIHDDPQSVRVDDDGDIFFVATGTTGITGLWTVRASGSNLVAVAVEGDTVPAATTGKYGTFYACGTNTNGGLAAWTADITNGTSPAGIFVANTVGQQAVVALDGDVAPGFGGRTLDEVWAGGPLVVFVSGTTSFVAWQSELSGAGADNAVFWRNTGPVAGPIVSIAGPGLSTPGVAPGQFGDVFLLDSANDPSHVALGATVVGNVDVQGAVYRVSIGAAPSTQIVLRDDAPAPGTSGLSFTEVLPSVGQDFHDEVAFDGGIGFSAVLSDASASIWWAPGGCSPFSVAAEGQPVPDVGGGTFGDLSSFTSVTTASDAIAFRAPILGLVGTTSGIFLRR